MADEITPHSKEILSSCMRFIDFEKKILDINLQSLFLELIACEELVKSLIDLYLTLNIDIQEIYGHCYDDETFLQRKNI